MNKGACPPKTAVGLRLQVLALLWAFRLRPHANTRYLDAPMSTFPQPAKRPRQPASAPIDFVAVAKFYGATIREATIKRPGAFGGMRVEKEIVLLGESVEIDANAPNGEQEAARELLRTLITARARAR